MKPIHLSSFMKESIEFPAYTWPGWSSQWFRTLVMHEGGHNRHQQREGQDDSGKFQQPGPACPGSLYIH